MDRNRRGRHLQVCLRGRRARRPSTWVDVYPNPYLAFKDACGKGVRFSGHLPGTAVKIYTMSGDLVREIADGETWDATNGTGEEVGLRRLPVRGHRPRTARISREGW